MLNDLTEPTIGSVVRDIEGNVIINTEDLHEFIVETEDAEYGFMQDIFGVTNREDIDISKANISSVKETVHVIKTLAYRYAFLSLNSREMGIDEEGLNLGIINARKMLILATNIFYEDSIESIMPFVIEMVEFIRDRPVQVPVDEVLEIKGSVEYSRKKFDYLDNTFTGIENELMGEYRSLPNDSSSSFKAQELGMMIVEEILLYKALEGLFSDDFSETEEVEDEEFKVNSNIENLNRSIFQLMIFEQGSFNDAIQTLEYLLGGYLDETLLADMYDQTVGISDKRSLKRLVGMLGAAVMVIEKWQNINDQ